MTSISNNNFDIPKDLLKKAAQSALVSSFVELNSTKVHPLNTKGQGRYQSPCHKVVIDLTANTSPEKSYDTSVFVKVTPRTSSTIKSAEKEIKIYEEFLKELQQRSYKGNSQVVPRCYLSQGNEENVMIFLENFKSSGFQDFDNKSPSGLDFNHALLAIENIARFHATSYFLSRQLGSKGKGKLEIFQKFPYLNPKSDSNLQSTSIKNQQKFSSIYAKFFEQIICKMVESDNPSLAFKLRRKIEPSAIFNKLPQILENEKYDNDDFYVACHGDYRTGNLLFKYSNDASNTKEPIECKMIDLKHVKFAPIASDLSYFFLTSTSGPMRTEFEEKLLAFYCDTFEEQLTQRYSANGQQIQDFDIEEFHRKLEDQYRRMLEFGFLNSCVVLPLIFGGETVSLESLERFDNVNEFDRFCQECFMNSELSQRVVSVVKQLVKNRIL